jgi:hypothetical protein
MELLDVLRQWPVENGTDAHALLCLGLRLFNVGATALKLGLSGYYHAAFVMLRDAFEIVNLLDLFRIEPSAVQVWRTTDDKTHKAEFGPVKVREKLAKHPDFTGQKRHPIYEVYSGHATHVTFKSFNLLMADGLVQGGPFFDLPKLKAVLEDLGSHLSHATLALSILVPGDDMPALHAKGEFLESLRAYHHDYIAPTSP